MYVNYNASPCHARVGDCVIRAISKATGDDWETTFVGVVLEAYRMCDMPSSNAVWGSYLKRKGFTRAVIPDSKVDNYTVADFAKDNPKGTYILAISGHVVCVQDGDWFDTWDSGDEVPVYYWSRRAE